MNQPVMVDEAINIVAGKFPDWGNKPGGGLVAKQVTIRTSLGEPVFTQVGISGFTDWGAVEKPLCVVTFIGEESRVDSIKDAAVARRQHWAEFKRLHIAATAYTRIIMNTMSGWREML